MSNQPTQPIDAIIAVARRDLRVSAPCLLELCDEVKRLRSQNALLKQEIDRRLDEAQVKLAKSDAEVVRLLAAVKAIDAQWGHYADMEVFAGEMNTAFSALVHITTAIRGALKAAEAAKGER
jgi:hypothetical protein